MFGFDARRVIWENYSKPRLVLGFELADMEVAKGSDRRRFADITLLVADRPHAPMDRLVVRMRPDKLHEFQRALSRMWPLPPEEDAALPETLQ